ncbi:MAG: ABC transporter substrate-binding protein [Deltaproteobacteria bacterium]|nr:ABC transporter substrate-binding protein [Deltaproteobacteria bacterium]
MPIALFAVMLTTFLATGASGYGNEKVLRLAYPSPAAIVYLPFWAAADLGIFRKHQLRIELVYIGSSPIAMASLISGEVDVVAGAGPAPVAAYLRGYRELAFFGSINNNFLWMIFSHPSIGSLPALRGKRVGTTRFGGTHDFATRYFLKRAGLEPRSDLSLIQRGAQPDLMAGLSNGSIDAAALGFPYNLVAKKNGFRELADLTQSGVSYPSSALLAKRRLLVEQRQQVAMFLRATVEAIDYVKKHRAESLAILRRYTKLTDTEVLSAAYDFHAQKVWPVLPKLNAEDLKLVLEHHSETDPKAREIDPTQLVDPSLTQELARAGWAQGAAK